MSRPGIWLLARRSSAARGPVRLRLGRRPDRPPEDHINRMYHGDTSPSSTTFSRELRRASRRAQMHSEPPRTALGRSNPYVDGWITRRGPHTLDPMVGEPATDVQGSPSLKVVGTDLRRFTNSPITRDHGVKSKRGRTAIDFSGGQSKDATKSRCL